MKHKNRIIVAAMWLAISLITLIAITIILWLIMPYRVATIQQPINILNENNEIRIGEAIVQELKISKPNNEPPIDVSRLLLCEDGNLVTLAPVTASNLPIGTYTVINDTYILPPKVAVGTRCTFVFRQAYKVNPIRAVPVEWRSEYFTVKGAK